MNSRGMIVLGLALVCGLGAMFSVRKVLSGRGSDATPKQDVLVASRPIAVEETITDEMLQVRSMPSDLVPPGALIDAKSARGRWAKIPLTTGDLLLDSKLAPKGTPTGLIGKLRPGMRAITIRVDEQTGISGFILPEYRVEVLKVQRDSSREKYRERARVLLRNVRVLASGTVIESPEDRSIQSTTVTLEVTPSQAELLVAAMQEGNLALALMPLHEMADSGPVEVEEPKEAGPPQEETVVAPPPPAPPVVQPEALLVRAVAPKPPVPKRLTLFPGRREAISIHAVPVEAESRGGANQESTRDERRPFQLDTGAEAGALEAGANPSGVGS